MGEWTALMLNIALRILVYLLIRITGGIIHECGGVVKCEITVIIALFTHGRRKPLCQLCYEWGVTAFTFSVTRDKNPHTSTSKQVMGKQNLVTFS